MSEPKKKYSFLKPLKRLSKQEIVQMLEKEVFSTNQFSEHVKEVSFKTKIDEEIVRDILKHYFTSISIVMNTVRKVKTKINVYGFFSFFIEKGSRV